MWLHLNKPLQLFQYTIPCGYIWTNHYYFFSIQFHVFTFEQTITDFLYTIPCVYFWTNHYRFSVHHSMCLLLSKIFDFSVYSPLYLGFEQTITDFCVHNPVPLVYYYFSFYYFFIKSVSCLHNYLRSPGYSEAYIHLIQSIIIIHITIQIQWIYKFIDKRNLSKK